MVYGTQITIVTGANLNQQTSLGGLTLYELYVTLYELYDMKIRLFFGLIINYYMNYILIYSLNSNQFIGRNAKPPDLGKTFHQIIKEVTHLTRREHSMGRSTGNFSTLFLPKKRT